MTDPIDPPERLFRLDLDFGVNVYAENRRGLTAASSLGAVVTVELPAARAHALSHLLQDWVSAFRLAPDRYDFPSTSLLGRAIEDAAAAVGDLGARACATRAAGSVPAERRIAAVGVLRTVEPAMSAVERIAVVDGAARWMEEDAGNELAYALLRAVCSSDGNAIKTYVELISPAPRATLAGTESGRKDEG